MTRAIPRVAAEQHRAEPPQDGIPSTFRCAGCDGRFPTGDTCHCASCHLTFTSVRPFDEHRKGGQCLSPAELTDRGLEPNAHGLWRHPRPADTYPSEA